ncbi:hypothetical protein Hanom_Chr13g01227241 [Helianthus anomalus]
MPMIFGSSSGGLVFLLRELVDNDERARETTSGGWVTGFSQELVVDSGYSRSTPFIPWVSVRD